MGFKLYELFPARKLYLVFPLLGTHAKVKDHASSSS